MHRLLALLLLLLAMPAGATGLRGLEIGGGARPTVTVLLDGAVAAPRSFVLADPQRIIVDFDGVSPARRSVDGAGVVLRARAGQFDPQTVRLVIELSRAMRVAGVRQGADHKLVITLAVVADADFAARLGKPSRTYADFVPEPKAAAPNATASKPGPAPGDFNLPDDALGVPPHSDVKPMALPPAPPTVTPAPSNPPAATPPATGFERPSRSGKKPLVMIDAGHGGKDTGTISVSGGRYEKDVTLAIARAVARRLEASGKVRVRLTRDDDRFIPLGGRVAIARRAKADLFISVHADSAPNDQARGASVYTLSEVASDAVAARLAARENKADIIAGVNLGIDAPEVGDIMIDLARRDTMNASVVFAETLQRALESQTGESRIGFRGEFHHFAGFYVLKAPDVPSVLIETGYLSNTDDAETLYSAEGQAAIARGIADAVERFLVRAPAS